MKQTFIWIVALFATASIAGASCGTCDAEKKSDKSSCPISECKDKIAELNLTDEQQKKVDELLKKCAEEECSKTACKKMNKGLKKILTDEQYAKWQEICPAGKKKGKEKSCGEDAG